MRIVWTDPGPVSGAWDTLRARGYEIGQLRQESISGGGRIVRRFPILVADSREFVEEAFGFLFDVAYIRGSTQSVRTLETYAESLLSWLTYAERERLQWRRPTTFMLAAYRDHLLGTRGFQKQATRPSARVGHPPHYSTTFCNKGARRLPTAVLKVGVRYRCRSNPYLNPICAGQGSGSVSQDSASQSHNPTYRALRALE